MAAENAEASQELSALLKAILGAAQTAANAALDCNEKLRHLPCAQSGTAWAGCQMAAAHKKPRARWWSLFALAIIAGIVGGYVTHLIESRNHNAATNPVRVRMESDQLASTR
jgi:hypothetical protein